MLAFIDYPSWLKPEIFSFLKISDGNFFSFLNFLRWYGLMYVIGFIISYIQSIHILKKDNLSTLNRSSIEEYYFWAILGLILGGRIFSCIVYYPGYYIKHPLEIIIPFQNGKFVGYEGMAFHGATIGVFLTSIIFTYKHIPDEINSEYFKTYILRKVTNFNDKKILQSLYKEDKDKKVFYIEEKTKKKKFSDYFKNRKRFSINKKTISRIFRSINFKINFRELCDLVFPIIPLGYTFGRIGNFINSELWGRITSSPIGILFKNADKVPLNLESTQKVINELGWKINETVFKVITPSGREINNGLGYLTDQNGNLTNILGINLPRHPSQLYEAFFEGIVLFFIIWFPARKYKPFKGFLASVYLIFYSIFRFIIEYFREPDSQFSNIQQGKYIGFILGHLSMGQILSLLLMSFGVGLGIYYYYLSKKDKLADLY